MLAKTFFESFIAIDVKPLVGNDNQWREKYKS